ncbi:S8 family peptidase [Desulfocicer niacini]
MENDIAIIDSGVNPNHPHVQEVSGGHGYVQGAGGIVMKNNDFMDEIGHGTAIAGIIRNSVPDAALYAVKIFKRELGAPASLLIEALRWAIEQRFRIIHLSLGLESEQHVEPLRQLCRTAHARNILILASARSPHDRIYPACFETVIGVCRSLDCDWGRVVFYPGAAVEFGAHGQPRPIPGLPQEQNFSGHSFAVAHVTALAARLLRENPSKDPGWLRDCLVRSVTACPS